MADEAGLRVWLDEWNLIPGEPWQEGLEQALDDSKCCVIFLGANGIGAWQNEELRAALAERVHHGGLRVVPVLLPGATRPGKESELPKFLRRLTWVKLQVFRPEDSHLFFGREALVERLDDYFERHRFLAVAGPSGSGKSSLVLAGLVPKLDDGARLVEIMTPREHPLEELAFALRRCFPDAQTPPTEELLRRLRSSSEALHLIGREIADAVGARRLFLVVDQFEELFTQTADAQEIRHFVANVSPQTTRPP